MDAFKTLISLITVIFILFIGAVIIQVTTAGPSNIVCYSDGVKTYEGRSKGYVGVDRNGISFWDAAGKQIKIQGDCVVTPTDETK